MSVILIRVRTTSRETLAVLVAMAGILLVAHGGNGFRAFGFSYLSGLLAAFFLAISSLIERNLRMNGSQYGMLYVIRVRDSHYHLTSDGWNIPITEQAWCSLAASCPRAEVTLCLQPGRV